MLPLDAMRRALLASVSHTAIVLAGGGRDRETLTRSLFLSGRELGVFKFTPVKHPKR